MFRENKTLPEVVVELDLDANTVLDYHGDYLRLVRMNSLVFIYKELHNDFPLFFHLYRRIKKERLTKQDINDLLENQESLKDMEHRTEMYSDFIRGQRSQIQHLEQEITRLQSKIYNYDGISPL
jgi:hypothetical protein